MFLSDKIARKLAGFYIKRHSKWLQYPVSAQQNLRKRLVHTARNTAFGKEHHFSKLSTYRDFIEAIPARTYEQYIPYIERISTGERDVLWHGRPVLFYSTSGTTTGSKYIPATKESIRDNLVGGHVAFMHHVIASGKGVIAGKILHLGGSSNQKLYKKIAVGRMSGTPRHRLPFYVRSRYLPSASTQQLHDLEKKLRATVVETYKANVTMIAGIPPWVYRYFQLLCEYVGKKTVRDIFPNLSCYFYGGVDFSPYQEQLSRILGGPPLPGVENYIASEGYFAYRCTPGDALGMLLLCDQGVFYEFILFSEVDEPNPTYYELSQLSLHTPYALVISTNAGLWRYMLGDVVSFTSLSPHRIQVVGRISHFLSAFGEHIIGAHVEAAMTAALTACPEVVLLDYTVAPQFETAERGLPHHEWFVLFLRAPDVMERFVRVLDEALQEANPYYKNLRVGEILSSAKVIPLQRDAVKHYMVAQGLEDMQCKFPRLANDRKVADKLLPHVQTVCQHGK